MTELKVLDVSHAKLTTNGVNTLRQKLPGTKVIVHWDKNPKKLTPTGVPKSKWDRLFAASSLQAPDLEATLRAALPKVSQQLDRQLGDWYVSSIFSAARSGRTPLRIFQIYDGNAKAFRLGCLLLVDRQEGLVKRIDKERIQSSLIPDDFKGSISRLPDLTGDESSDLPTESWEMHQGSAGTTTSIYRTGPESIPRVFRIHFPHQSTPPQVHWGGWHLALDNQTGFILSVRARLYKPVKGEEKRRLEAKVSSQLKGQVEITSWVDESQPPRTMATFRWSSKKNTFVGPPLGPEG